MGKIAKILLDAIERCDCEIERIDARLCTPLNPKEYIDLEKEKDNFITCKKYLEKVLN